MYFDFFHEIIHILIIVIILRLIMVHIVLKPHYKIIEFLSCFPVYFM